MSGTVRDDALADILEFALAGRPDRVTNLLVGGMDPATRQELAASHDALGALAAALPEASPPPALRDRLMATLQARREAPACRVLVVCDMINDHLTPGSVLEVPRARDIVPALAARLDVARKSGVPVVFVLDRHEPDDPDLDEWGQHAVAGTKGAEPWPDLAPQPGDREVTKSSYSAFYQSKLEDVLAELGADTIELTGCASEVQLMATATDALQRGYRVELPAGLHAGANEIAEAVTAGVLAALVPYAPARKSLLARLAG